MITVTEKLSPVVSKDPEYKLNPIVTAITAAGVEVKPEWKLDGVDLMPYLTGQRSGSPHEALYWRLGDQMAIRSGNYKLVKYDINAETRTGGRRQGVSPTKLYDLTSDTAE